MGGISNRLSKLEQASRTTKGVIRSKVVRDQLVSGLAVDRPDRPRASA